MADAGRQQGAEEHLPEFSAQQFLAIQNQLLSAGGALQMFKPGALEVVAKIIERDLKSVEALASLSTVGKLRGQRFAELIRKAEEFSQAARAMVFALDMVDPADASSIIVEGVKS